MTSLLLRRLAVCGAVGAMLLVSPASRAVDDRQRGCRVRIEAPGEPVAEGGRAAFRILRDDTRGDIGVLVTLSGESRLGVDYALVDVEEGVEDEPSNGVVVTIPDGQASVEFTIEIVDDASAEADETVTVELTSVKVCAVDDARRRATLTIPRNDFAVTTADDAGEGSLRQAILNANAIEGPDVITFDAPAGTFKTPQTITLASELPDLIGELTIDGYIEDRLWAASGVTVSGAGRYRVFRVPADARVTMQSLTVADGFAENGAGILNEGTLVVKGVTFVGNRADADGAGVASPRGDLTVINSTFTDNAAGNEGGGLVHAGDTATVTNCTFSGNKARRGGGLASRSHLVLRNTILAHNDAASDCLATGTFAEESTHNLIVANEGCGTPFLTADPRLERLGYYNGPTQTLAVSGSSPAINLGDNPSAVDENGRPLVWDQRGGGDPRFVAGFTDIGAFEHQRLPVLVVDTAEDSELRGCTPAGQANCPLRAAIELANVTDEPELITFDPRVFDAPRAITLTRPLPPVTTRITINASRVPVVTIRPEGNLPVFDVLPGGDLRLKGIRVEEEAAQEHPTDDPATGE